MDKQKIIIIGGGIGGLMTAIALNKKGIPSAIYERANSADTGGAGLALWANATQILSKFGLLNNILAYSNVLHELKTTTSTGRLLNVVRLKGLEDKFHFPSIILLRSDLQKELMKAISISQIHFNKQCVKIESRTGTSIIHFDDGTVETANVVIVADGIHSMARKSIFNLPALKYAGRTSWRGVAEFDQQFFPDNTNYEILGKGRRIGIFPLPNKSAYWYAAVNMSEEVASRQKRTPDCVLSHFQDWAEPVNALMKNTREAKLILTNIYYTSGIKKLVSENIALLGDAAHPMTPDLGQGACQAIEDAYILAECLSQNGPVARGLYNYEIRRLPRINSIARNSFRMGRLRQMENPIGVTIRNSLFRLLPAQFALKLLERNIDFYR